MGKSKAGGAPARRSIAMKATWDLSKLYASERDWEASFKGIEALLKKLLSFKGRLGRSPETLAAAFESADKLEMLLEKLHTYAHLKSDEDTGSSENLGRLDRIESRQAEIEGETAWFEPELLALPKSRFDELRKSPALAFYRRTLKDLELDRRHTLSAPEERLLGMASEVLSAPYKTFSLLNDADLKLPAVKDARGVETELTHGNYIKLLESSDRKLRQAAFAGMHGAYGQFKNTFASILDASVKAHVMEAKARRYKSALHAALHPDRISEKVYDGLVKTVRRRLPALHSYFKLRAKALGLRKLDIFDVYNPLVQECEMEISWSQARDWVLEALLPLGADYQSTLKKAFDERWIDYLESKGKKSGAYSSGCYRKPPYILMNFAGNIDGVFTLAHELGHSLHSHLSDSAQDFHYAGYNIFVAEVASTTNELLLHRHLMKEAKSDRLKAQLLNHLADELRGTLFRQTMFAEFERSVHEMAASGEPLTADALCERYYKLTAEYHGPHVSPDRRIQYEWARIPHFHYGFYVYKYATGISAAVALSKAIIEGDAERHLRFLKAGDSKDALDIMRDAGVDFSTPAPIEAAIDLFEETVAELGRLLR